MSKFAASRCSAAAAERATNAPSLRGSWKAITATQTYNGGKARRDADAAALYLCHTVMSKTFTMLVVAVFCLCFLKGCVSLLVFVFILFKLCM